MGVMKIKIGQTYNRLTALSFSHKDARSRLWFNFRCKCGNKSLLHTGNITSGNTKSCGCLATEMRKARRISDNHSEVTAIILGYKRHAVNRGYKWLITRDQAKTVIILPCHYCGLEPSNIKKTKNSLGDGLRYSGIDRKNNTGDYTPDNVVPCCKVCNYAKSNLSLDQFLDWAKRLNAMAEQWGKSAQTNSHKENRR